MSMTFSSQQKEEPLVTKEQPIATAQTIDTYVQETITAFQQLESRKADLILELARKISLLPGVEKKMIARTIIGRFRKFGVQIQKRYVYRVLPMEYKNENLSLAATENNKLRQENGYDAKQGKYFEPKDYNMDFLATYSKSTLIRIVTYLHEENRALKKQIEELKH
jgi:hypothetical protein